MIFQAPGDHIFVRAGADNRLSSGFNRCFSLLCGKYGSRADKYSGNAAANSFDAFSGIRGSEGDFSGGQPASYEGFCAALSGLLIFTTGMIPMECKSSFAFTAIYFLFPFL